MTTYLDVEWDVKSESVSLVSYIRLVWLHGLAGCFIFPTIIVH